MKIYDGRPADFSSRDAVEQNTYEVLENLGISYQRVDHPAAYTMEDCAAVDEAFGTELCKNLFLCNRQETQFYLLLMPGAKNFRTKDLSAQLGVSRLSFANENHLMDLLGVKPGSVSVMGLINDMDSRVRLVIDRDVLASEYICCHPCRNTSSIKIKTSDIIFKFLPFVHHNFTEIEL